MSFPSTACLVQDRLKMTCPAVDMQAACAGFMYALITGAAYVASEASDQALIIGGDANCAGHESRRHQDLSSRSATGARAMLLACGRARAGNSGYSLGADGSGGDLLSRPACGSRMPPSIEYLEKGLQFMHMDGRAVFRWAVAILCDTIQDVLASAGDAANDVDLYLPHQANIRIINAAIDVLKINRNKVFNNLEKYGNTSAGSVPLAPGRGYTQEGRLERGDLIVL